MSQNDASVGANDPGGQHSELTAAVQALTQTTQVLTATATQMMQLLQSLASSALIGQVPAGGGVLATPVAQINTWEDDPFSEATPTQNPAFAAPITVNVPVNNAPSLQTAIVDPRPAPARYTRGTANFRYWTAAEALARGVNFWAPLLPAGTRWSTFGPVLQVTLVAGRDLNAFYSRTGLRFFQQTVRNVQIFSGESPDVVCHELGHALLDAFRPQLFNAASIEAAAFHEAFGDMSSILSALQLPTLRQKVLAETQGRLNVNSRLARVAEQLGWAIRQLSPTAVDRDSLRNAANRFFYQPPAQLPPSAPANQLSSEPHSFARVFTGAFLDALARMLTIMGAANDQNLVAVSRDLGQLLVDGIRTAPIVSAYFSQVAAAMLQADQARNNERYRVALSSAFVQHGILSPTAMTALAAAPVPHLRATPAPAEALGMAGVSGFGGSAGGTPMAGARVLLSYDDGEDDAHLRGAEDAPELPTRPVATEFGLTIVVHAPAEPERFAVASAAPDQGSVEKPEPEDAARYFIEDLLRLGRVDLRTVRGMAPELTAAVDDKRRETSHELVDTPEGAVLKRRYFDCGFPCSTH